ncbi:hypothetical protein [Kiloniella litopenaei]|uniref:hypothetical protein n=1 Tax=Kiloniella litopenaei TaxID=1549748 RepID=UPI003BAA039B
MGSIFYDLREKLPFWKIKEANMQRELAAIHIDMARESIRKLSTDKDKLKDRLRAQCEVGGDIERKVLTGPLYGGDAEWSWAGQPAFREQLNYCGEVNIRVIDEALTRKVFNELKRQRSNVHQAILKR